MQTLDAARFDSMPIKTLSQVVAGLGFRLGTITLATTQKSGLAQIQNIEWIEENQAALEELFYWVIERERPVSPT